MQEQPLKITLNCTEFFDHYTGNVVICSSVQNYREQLEVLKQLRYCGWRVLSVQGSHGLEESRIRRTHFETIFWSDAVVLVTDKSMYVTEAVQLELKFAEWLNKPIFGFDGVEFYGSADIDETILSMLKINMQTVNHVINEFAAYNNLEVQE